MFFVPVKGIEELHRLMERNQRTLHQSESEKERERERGGREGWEGEGERKVEGLRERARERE
jgi:hypothetical protein